MTTDEVTRLQLLNAHYRQTIQAFHSVMSRDDKIMSLEDRVKWLIATCQAALETGPAEMQEAGLIQIAMPSTEEADRFIAWLCNSGEQDFMNAAEMRGEPHSFVFNYNEDERRVLVTPGDADEEDETDEQEEGAEHVE